MVKAKQGLFEFTLFNQLKRNYSLIPIVVCGLFGMSLSAFHMTRLMTRSPDVSVNRRGNPRPYERLETSDGKPVQYKYFSTLNYNALPAAERPNYAQD